MKIYVTWSPNDMSPLLESYIDGVNVPLSNLSRTALQRCVQLGIHRALGISKEVMVDSLTKGISKVYRYPYDPKSQRHILSLQAWMKPDYIVHKDYPLLSKDLSEREKRALLEKTIRNAEIMIKLEDEYGLHSVIYVIQGWDTQSMVYTAERYRDLGVKMYGLGSSINTTPGELVERLKAIRGVIGEKAYLHVFGALKPSQLLVSAKLVNSVDTSTPFKAAAAGHVLIAGKGLKRVKIDKVSLEDLDLPPDLKAKLEEALEEIRKKSPLEKAPITRLKRTLAAVNAYSLKKYLSMQHA